MQYIPYFITHKEEFEIIGAKNDPNNIWIPKPNATKEGIQSLYRFEVECEDEFVVDDKQELCKRMIEKFKSSECFKHKTDAERQEIIDYLSSTTYEQ